MAITLNGTTGITTPDITSEAGLTVDGVSFASGAPDNTLVTTSGGNVGIGTSSTPVSLSLTNSATLGWAQSATETVPAIFRQASSAATVVANGYKYTATANGFASGYSSSFAKSAISVGDGSVRFYTDTAAAVAVGTDVTPTERARIDSSGNLLVGKTAANSDNAGFEANATGFTAVTRSDGTCFVVDRLVSDGVLVSLRKDNTAVGSIGTNSSNSLYIAAPNQNLGVKLTSDDFRPTNGSGTDSDNVMDLGNSNVRWDDVYATNGTIQTSDRNEKQDIEELSEAEKRVATAAKGLIRKFRWIDSVAERGDDARIHVGVIAQDLQAAFEAEGLDAGRYAMFISSTWWEATETYTDDEGVEQTRVNTYETAEEAPAGAVERTRLGVRYPELLAFIIGAL